MTVLQALSLAGGLDRFASAKNSRILRNAGADQQRVEIALNLEKILANREEDLALKPGDILFVPRNGPKAAGYRAMEAAIQIGTGVVIWR
jgi:protein involved in polysaccharide export with SLBB domain